MVLSRKHAIELLYKLIKGNDREKHMTLLSNSPNKCVLHTSKFPTEVSDGNGETGAVGLSEDVVFGSDNGSEKSGVKV